jgi:HPt (histidine-containing phosphotransfer) domain-containing protein
VLSEDVIAQMRELDPDGSKGLLSRVISSYVAEAPKLIEALRTAIEAADSNRTKELAHALKSSSALIGAARVSAVAAGLEALPPDEMSLMAGDYVDAIAAELEVAKTDLETLATSGATA